jgi:branched-chain amino acid transport system permease protein
MTLQTATDLLVGAVTLGGIYALLAFTLSMALATTHVLNVAHGTLMVLGAAMATLLLRFVGLAPSLAIFILVVFFALMGVLFDAVFVRPILHKPPETILTTSIVVTFGLALALETLLGFYWARLVHPEPSFSLSLPVPHLEVGSIILSTQRLIILGYAAAAIGLFHLFLRQTPVGKAARALAQDYEGALIVGVNPRAVSRVIFTLGVLFTAISGAFYVLTVPLDPYQGIWLTLVALIVVVIGGVGRLLGALLGGILLGMVQVLTVFVVGSGWSPLVFLLVLFVVLVFRPQGLLEGRR